jgi:hypothetical protein
MGSILAAEDHRLKRAPARSGGPEPIFCHALPACASGGNFLADDHAAAGSEEVGGGSSSSFWKVPRYTR